MGDREREREEILSKNLEKRLRVWHFRKKDRAVITKLFLGIPNIFFLFLGIEFFLEEKNLVL